MSGGKLPEGWQTSSIGDLCKKVTDGSQNPKRVKLGYQCSCKTLTMVLLFLAKLTGLSLKLNFGKKISGQVLRVVMFC
jgi:hypothetical protein